MRGAAKIGTTGRGIGPAYEDKVARRAVRFGDLASDSVLTEKLDALVAYHNVWLGAAGHALADADKMRADLLAMRDELLLYLGQSWRCLADARAANKRVLFEGAQGVMLDIDHGTYPFVTSATQLLVRLPQVLELVQPTLDLFGYYQGLYNACWQRTFSY